MLEIEQGLNKQLSFQGTGARENLQKYKGNSCNKDLEAHITAFSCYKFLNASMDVNPVSPCATVRILILFLKRDAFRILDDLCAKKGGDLRGR